MKLFCNDHSLTTTAAAEGNNQVAPAISETNT